MHIMKVTNFKNLANFFNDDYFQIWILKLSHIDQDIHKHAIEKK